MNRIAIIMKNKRFVCKCFSMFTIICALLSIMLSGNYNDLSLTLNTTSQIALSYSQRTNVFADKVIEKQNNSKVFNNSNKTYNQSSLYSNQKIEDILKNNKNASLFFDKNGKFMKAIIYDANGKAVSFAVLDKYNNIKYYKNTSIRNISLRRGMLPTVLNNMLQNPDGNDESKTISTASTWSALKTMVKNGGSIRITADLVANRQIEISKDVTIYSEIDSIKKITRADVLKRYSMFSVTGNVEAPINLTIKNINFDGKSVSSSVPAIYSGKETNLMLENVSVLDFINEGTKYPGVISFFGKELTVKNSVFTNCVSYMGGAVYSGNDSIMYVYSSAFIDNKTTEGPGGAIYSAGNCNIFSVENGNTEFYENRSYSAQGGAVWTSGTLTLYAEENSEILMSENSAIFGGAVYAATVNFGGKGNIQLSKNEAQKYGGAIYTQKMVSNGNNRLTVSENTAKINGGGIYFSTAGANDFTLHNVIMTNNIAAKYGGAIFVSNGNLTIARSDFKGNNSHTGGAVYIDGTVNIGDNSNFVSNYAKTGGAVYCSVFESSAEFNFTDNYAIDPELGKGGAVFCTKAISMFFENAGANNAVSPAVFDSNRSIYGGAIFVLGNEKEGTVANSLISGNNVEFLNNSATGNGGALYFEKGIATVSGGSFSGNTAENEGGAIYSAASEIIVKENLFSFNKAKSGGAIASKSPITNVLFNARFTNNNHAQKGGAIYVYKGSIKPIVNISNAVFSDISEDITPVDDNYNDVSGDLLYIENSVANIKNTVFKNSIAKNGGAIYLSNTEAVFDGNSFENNTAKSNGGAIYSSNGSLKLINSKTVFSVNKATSKGGAIYLAQTDVNICNAEFSKNESGTGGAICAVSNSSLNIAKPSINDTSNAYSVTFTSNNATSNGGAIYTNNSVSNIYSAEFVSNSAKNGGAVYAYNLNISSENDIKFINNTAKNFGGAVYAYGKGVFSVNESIGNTIFKNNAATSGGAIYSEVSACVNSGEFTGNNAMSCGGVIYGRNKISIGSAEINSDLLLKNNTAGLNGGSVYSKNNVYVYNNAVLSDNAASNGGAIYSENKVNAIAGALINNSATCDGGAIYGGGIITIGQNLVKNNLYILNNSAKENGGGIFSKGEITLNKGYISANTASNGGGIYADDNVVFGECIVGSALDVPEAYLASFVDDTDNYNILSNINVVSSTADFEEPHENLIDEINRLIKIGNSALNGGGIYIANNSANISLRNETKASIIVLKSYIRGNLAEYGGGLFLNASLDCMNSADVTENIALVSGGAVAIAGKSSKNVILRNLSPYHNYAENGSLVYTNLISSDEENIVTAILSNCVLSDCIPENGIVTYKGAAVYSENNVGFENCELKNNKSEIGGAVYSTGNSYFIDSMLSDNTAIENGGAIYSENDISFKNCTISNNSSANGGAVYALNNSAFENCSVLNNKASVNGGAVYSKYVAVHDEFDSNKQTYINFANNTALQGGAIYSTDNVSIIGSQFKGNKATKGNGGAVYQCKGYIIIDNSSFDSNTSTKDGGAIYILSGADESFVTNSEFKANSNKNNGGAVFVSTYGDFNIISSAFNSNKSNNGAGIYVENADHFTVTGAHDNITVFNDCIAKNDGGAIYLNSIKGTGEVKLDNNVYINYNQARNNGAGIYIKSTGEGKASVSAEFINNIVLSDTGKGIAVFLESGKLELCDSKISDNYRSVEDNSYKTYGGGIYISENAHLKLNGCTITNNEATYGGGVYCDGILEFDNEAENKILNNKATYGGGVYTTSDILLDNAIIGGNRSVYGGGVFADRNATVTFGDLTIGSKESINSLFNVPHFNDKQSNEITNQFDEETLNSVVLLGGNVADFGGGLFLNGAKITFLNYSNATSYISSNLAVYAGGGICSAALSSDVERGLYISTINAGLKISGNVSRFGGGIYTADSCTIDSNVSVSDNMAVIAEKDSVDIGGNGGALYLGNISELDNLNNADTISSYSQLIKKANTESAEYNLNSTLLAGNVASQNGGAIYVSDGILSTENINMLSNHAKNNGGAIYLHSGEALILTGSIGNGKLAEGNSATNGGAIYIENSDNCILGQDADNILTISGNSATNGGGIFAHLGTTNFTDGLVVSKNKAELGGGIMSPNDLPEYNGVSVIENTATLYGGGLFLGSDNFKEMNTEAVYLIGSAKISENTAYDGGGVFVRSGYYYLDSGVEVSYNTASRNGAGICFSLYAKDIQDNTFKDCDDVYMEMSATVKGNKRADNASGNSYGGGIYVNRNDYLAIYGSEITGNDLGISNRSNSKKTYGGAIYAAKGSTVELYAATIGCDISDINSLSFENIKAKGGNIADYGGAIYLSDAKLVISDDGVDEYAVYDYQENYGISPTRITGNYAYINGGGIVMYSSGSRLTDEIGNDLVDENGSVIRSHSEVIISNKNTSASNADFKQEISYNMTEGIGGAIYVADNGDNSVLNIKDARFDSNVVTSTLKDGKGGAIYIGGGKISISDSEFLANRASVSGGSLYITGGLIDINSTTFKNATATSGGAAIFAIREGGGNSTININTSKFINNTSFENGGAISAIGGIVLSVENTQFLNNNASTGSSMYLGNLITGAKLINCMFGENSCNANQLYCLNSKIDLANVEVNGGNTKETSAIISNGSICIDGTISINGSVYLNGKDNFIRVDEAIVDGQLSIINPIDLIVLEERVSSNSGKTVFDITACGNSNTALVSDFCNLNSIFSNVTLSNSNGLIVLVP